MRIHNASQTINSGCIRYRWLGFGLIFIVLLGFVFLESRRGSVYADTGIGNTPTATATPTCAGAGSLDNTFGDNGSVTTAFFGIDDRAHSVAIQPDGKLVAAGISNNGSNFDFALVRYNVDGSLDKTFDGDGKVTTDFIGSDDIAREVSLQSDGKIVVSGYSGTGTQGDNFAVARYNFDGSLDATFDGDGMVTTHVLTFDDRATSAVIQADAKILVAGLSANGPDFYFSLVRYNTNGSLDTTFSGDGKVVTMIGQGQSQAYSVAIQPDNKIVAAGWSRSIANIDFALARYNLDGSLDTTFDGDGKVTTPILSATDVAYFVAIYPDGKIVAAGYSNGASNFHFALVRYNSNGSLDTTFDGDGKFTSLILSTFNGILPNSVSVQPDGKIVAAGFVSGNPALARFNVDGSLDTTFNGNGIVTTPLVIVESVTIQPDGKIVAAGSTEITSGIFALARHHGAPCSSPTPTNTPTNTATDTPTPMPTVPSISGTVTYGNALVGTPNPRPVSNVLMSGAGSPPVSTLTDAGGAYLLNAFGSGAYTVTPTKTGGVNGALTSFDAALIAQHVVGPPSPQLTGNQLVVADVSGNGTISSFDAGLVADYVISLPPTGSAGNWIFVPVSRAYPSVTTSVTGEDYAALLMGDVSGNWNPATHPRGTVVRGRMSDVSEEGRAAEKPITVTVADEHLVSTVGKEIVIPVSIDGVTGKEIISYEFDLRYDPSVIQPLAEPVDVAGTASRGLSVVKNATEPGLLRVVVYGAIPIDENGVLLNLRFTAVGSVGAISPLAFERIMFNEGEPVTAATDGQVLLTIGRERNINLAVSVK